MGDLLQEERLTMDYSEQIREKRLRELDDLERTERLKLRICVSVSEIFDILMSNHSSVSERISILLDLQPRDRELLQLIRIVDLDLQKISDNILRIKEEKERLS